MRLLFDENLSPRLVELLAQPFPESKHVHACRLGSSPDHLIWLYAKEYQFIIVSKDSDFSERSVLHGHPPKVIWLQLGNCTTDQIATLLLKSADALARFGNDETSGCLILRGR